MKKQLLTIIFLFFSFNLFSTECILKEDFNFRNLDLKKGELLHNVSDLIEDCTKWNKENPYNLAVLFIDNNNKQNFIDADLLIPKETKDLFDSEITFSGLFAKNKILVYEDQIEILNWPIGYMEAFKEHYPKEYDFYIINPYDNDIDILYRNYITNSFLNLRSPNIDYNISILNITKQDNNKYILDCKAGHITKQDNYTEKYINNGTLFIYFSVISVTYPSRSFEFSINLIAIPPTSSQ